MLETRPGLPINEPILLKADSILTEFCQDLSPSPQHVWQVGVGPGDKDGDKFGSVKNEIFGKSGSCFRLESGDVADER